MRYVYLLQHSYEYGEHEETKIIGIYCSEENALNAIEKYKGLPGFKDYADCFYIDKYEIDRNYWEEGFVKWDNET